MRFPLLVRLTRSSRESVEGTGTHRAPNNIDSMAHPHRNPSSLGLPVPLQNLNATNLHLFAILDDRGDRIAIFQHICRVTVTTFRGARRQSLEYWNQESQRVFRIVRRVLTLGDLRV